MLDADDAENSWIFTDTAKPLCTKTHSINKRDITL
jgi:hypothetical protein